MYKCKNYRLNAHTGQIYRASTIYTYMYTRAANLYPSGAYTLQALELVVAAVGVVVFTYRVAKIAARDIARRCQQLDSLAYFLLYLSLSYSLE